MNTSHYKFFLLSLLFSQIVFFSIGQTYVGNITLKTQAQVNSFGDFGFSRIEGNLHIGDTSYFDTGIPSDITDLTPLETIDSISLSLEIFGNGNLQSLNGLDSIRYIGNELIIRSNNQLQSLHGFENIDSIYNRLLITACGSLVNLEGLDSIVYVEKLIISHNHSLTSFDGLYNLNTIGDYLSLRGNNNIESLNGLDQITSLVFFSIFQTKIKTLSGLDNLTEISHFRIEDNEFLHDYCLLSDMYSNGYLNQLDTVESKIENNFFNPTFQQIMDNECSTTPLDLTENNTSGSITLSPNPTTGNLNLNFGESDYKRIRIINQLGQVVHQKNNIPGSTYSLYLDVPEGVYTIEIFSNTARKQFKVIKQ